MLPEIFSQQSDKLVTVHEVRDVVCCLLDAMSLNATISTHADFPNFNPGAVLANKYPGDLVTKEELKQIRCCFFDFFENF